MPGAAGKELVELSKTIETFPKAAFKVATSLFLSLLFGHHPHSYANKEDPVIDSNVACFGHDICTYVLWETDSPPI